MLKNITLTGYSWRGGSYRNNMSSGLRIWSN